MLSMFITAEDTAQGDSFTHSFIRFHFIFVVFIEFKGLKIVLFATIVR
jgi:hypothetical protein